MGLEHVLNAKSVAIVGASKKETKRGFQAIKILLEEKFEGRIFPVNPKEESILGLPCFGKVSEIDEPVEMALITTPARTIPGILEDCAKKGRGGGRYYRRGVQGTGEGGKRPGRPDGGGRKGEGHPVDRTEHVGHDEPQQAT